ncbi:hypothetical protein PSHT_13458 [Puccinia striiformis]|nr:hypothetical protein PSHT_13458 [Puccinia striiformis]
MLTYASNLEITQTLEKLAVRSRRGTSWHHKLESTTPLEFCLELFLILSWLLSNARSQWLLSSYSKSFDRKEMICVLAKDDARMHQGESGSMRLVKCQILILTHILAIWLWLESRLWSLNSQRRPVLGGVYSKHVKLAEFTSNKRLKHRSTIHATQT